MDYTVVVQQYVVTKERINKIDTVDSFSIIFYNIHKIKKY